MIIFLLASRVENVSHYFVADKSKAEAFALVVAVGTKTEAINSVPLEMF